VAVVVLVQQAQTGQQRRGEAPAVTVYRRQLPGRQSRAPVVAVAHQAEALHLAQLVAQAAVAKEHDAARLLRGRLVLITLVAVAVAVFVPRMVNWAAMAVPV
jgi:hypothetical protein